MRDPRSYITRAPDLTRLAPRVAVLFAERDAIVALQEALVVSGGREGEEVARLALQAVEERVAAFEPATMSEAVSLLAAVFLDGDAHGAWGLFEAGQVRVLATVKRLLAAQLSTRLAEGQGELCGAFT